MGDSRNKYEESEATVRKLERTEREQKWKTGQRWPRSKGIQDTGCQLNYNAQRAIELTT